MDIIVAMKQVPDVSAGIAINDQGTDLARDQLGFVANPFDEWALEEALLLKEVTDGWVTVVALDDPGIDPALYRALALGADHAVKLVGTGAAWIDSHRRAGIMASWIREQLYDLILSGVQAPDDLDGQLPALLAAGLGHPFASVVVGVEATETGVIATQEFGGGRIGQLELALPAVLGIQVSLRDPRYVSDMRIRLASMGGGIEEVALDVETDVPTTGSGLIVRRVFRPEASRRAEMLPASPDEAADAILGLLRERGLIA
jgi:electron transfer flavoprotein beta subunit